MAFVGTVDFTPAQVVVPGPTGFPPDQAEPGSIGDANYSPLIEIDSSGIVLNAPQLVHGSNLAELHDSVVSIDFDAMEVTLGPVPGFYNDMDILYVSTDVSDSATAALEASTFAPNLNTAPGLGSNDPETLARSAIIPIVNGQTGVDHPERQGLQSAVMGEGPPLNVVQSIPNGPDYSPLWDVHPAVWTDEAIAAGERVLLGDDNEASPDLRRNRQNVSRAVEDGLLVSGGAGPMNPSLGGLMAADFIVNCPVFVVEKLYFAQFGNGEGFRSDIVLTNAFADETVSGKVRFFDDDGVAIPVNIDVDFSIPPLATVTMSTDDQGDLAVGSAVVTSDNSLGGVVRFSMPDIGIAGVGASQPLDGFAMPVRRKSGGINTGIAIHNTEGQALTLNLTLRNSLGEVVASGTETIENFPVAGHLSRFIDELFPDADTDDFEGSLVVQVTGGKVAATAIELDPAAGLFTVLPVIPLN